MQHVNVKASTVAHIADGSFNFSLFFFLSFSFSLCTFQTHIFDTISWWIHFESFNLLWKCTV